MADIALVLSKIKLYRNFPVPNQPFGDIFPIFRNPVATEAVISHLVTHILSTHSIPDLCAIVALEARGFFFGLLIASRLGLPCVPVRKKGTLPGEVVSVSYEKDYGKDAFEMKSDAFEGVETKGKRVILVDGLLGMGGTIMAAKQLVEKLGVEVAEAVFIFDVAIPGYTEAVNMRLGGLKRYAMVTLTATNLPEPVN
ncbi:Adenine phosphoribosyltransferase [Lachnellula suecica]|uniref:adenine phosphoribosyltransferase n=1 Tax=Lachnellula suecica TaxID=602035 RepID=A0A8T9C967_9HELO|nr:Adenine phosphoribosyltransferase [Lachnellula suecica]